ncbi:MAG: helix-turn-helix domain-containing protein [Magnetospirillum sp. WYHS-4]
MNTIVPLVETAKTVTLNRADYEALLEALEDAETAATLNANAAKERAAGKAAYRADCLSVGLVERMLAGESPVRVWREHRGLTSKALAEAAGLPRGYLSEIETGKKPGSLSALKRLAEVLRVGLDDIT